MTAGEVVDDIGIVPNDAEVRRRLHAGNAFDGLVRVGLTGGVRVFRAAVCCGIWYMRGQERIQNAKLAAECKKTTVPAPQSQTKDKKATAVKDAKKISVQVQPVKNAPAKAAADKK